MRKFGLDTPFKKDCLFRVLYSRYCFAGRNDHEKDRIAGGGQAGADL